MSANTRGNQHMRRFDPKTKWLRLPSLLLFLGAFADLEARLRKAGIRVVDKSEAELLPGMPTLYAKLMIFQPIGDQYTSLSDVQLRQEVSLRRQPVVTEMTATWQNSALGSRGGMPPDKSIKSICDGLGSVVDWFIRDYKSANSK